MSSPHSLNFDPGFKKYSYSASLIILPISSTGGLLQVSKPIVMYQWYPPYFQGSTPYKWCLAQLPSVISQFHFFPALFMKVHRLLVGGINPSQPIIPSKHGWKHIKSGKPPISLSINVGLWRWVYQSVYLIPIVSPLNPIKSHRWFTHEIWPLFFRGPANVARGRSKARRRPRVEPMATSAKNLWVWWGFNQLTSGYLT